jgi:hypothetical protein
MRNYGRTGGADLFHHTFTFWKHIGPDRSGVPVVAAGDPRLGRVLLPRRHGRDGWLFPEGLAGPVKIEAGLIFSLERR